VDSSATYNPNMNIMRVPKLRTHQTLQPPTPLKLSPRPSSHWHSLNRREGSPMHPPKYLALAVVAILVPKFPESGTGDE
jgi:hypothetical protein